LHYFIPFTMQMGSKLNINILIQEKIIYQNSLSINFSFTNSTVLPQCNIISKSYKSIHRHTKTHTDILKHTQTLINHEPYQKQSRVRRIILAATAKCPVSDTPKIPLILHSVMNILWDQVRILHEIRGECYVRLGLNIAYQGWILYEIRTEYYMRSGVNVIWDQAWKIVWDMERILYEIRLEYDIRRVYYVIQARVIYDVKRL
jgi:hypothetical protein